jgi:hypothetical protein
MDGSDGTHKDMEDTTLVQMKEVESVIRTPQTTLLFVGGVMITCEPYMGYGTLNT